MLKTPKSQKAQQLLSQKNRNPSSQSTSSSTTSAQPQAGSQNRTNLSSEQPNAQKQTNRPSTNTRPTKDKHISNRQSKGSNDAVKLHNRFGVFEPRVGPGVERIDRTPPPLAQSVETWPIGVRLVCRELRPLSLEERILVIERVSCGRHATHFFGLNFS